MFLDEYKASAAIERLIEKFDFESVKKTMDALDWKWAPKYTIPTLEEIESQARYVLSSVAKEAMETDDVYLRTAGFVGRYTSGELSLSFVVSSWEVELDREIDSSW